MKRRHFLGCCLALPAAAVLSAPPAAPGLGLGAAINKAGRQRMLSQRMAKAFAMQVTGVMPERAEIILEQSRRLFESQLGELKGALASDAIRTALGDLDSTWGRYREALARERTRDNVRLVLLESEATLRIAHQLTGLYEKQSAGNTGRLVNLSGRQRMLSQRMAKCFFMQQAGLEAGVLAAELAGARRDFVAALGELNGAAENTPEIRAELGLANTQWLFFEQALNGREAGPEVAARNVASTSERILEVMDSLTGRYELLLRG